MRDEFGVDGVENGKRHGSGISICDGGNTEDSGFENGTCEGDEFESSESLQD